MDFRVAGMPLRLEVIDARRDLSTVADLKDANGGDGTGEICGDEGSRDGDDGAMDFLPSLGGAMELEAAAVIVTAIMAVVVVPAALETAEVDAVAAVVSVVALSGDILRTSTCTGTSCCRIVTGAVKSLNATLRRESTAAAETQTERVQILMCRYTGGGGGGERDPESRRTAERAQETGR